MNKRLIYFATLYTPLLLIINLGLGSQEDPLNIGNIPLNQIINWIVIFGAAIVVRNSFNKSPWSLIIIFLTIISKFFILFFGDTTFLYYSYKISVLSLFVLLGTIYINKYLDLIYKQVLILCVINTIMMFLQVINVGEWTQFLSTESTFKFGERITYDVLFTSIDQLQYSVIQARPSGFLRSNNILSGVLFFALALHFSRVNHNYWSTFVLLTMVVLASARMGYVGYLSIVTLILFRGNRAMRINVLRSIPILFFNLIMYAFLFPGLFLNFWRSEAFLYNFYIRFNDISSAFTRGSAIRNFMQDSLLNTPVANWDTESGISGYTILVKYLPFVLPVILIIIPIYVMRLKKQRNIAPQLAWVSFLCMTVFILFPAAVPIFQDQFYWFVGGFALSPLFINSSSNKILKTSKSIQTLNAGMYYGLQK